MQLMAIQKSAGPADLLRACPLPADPKLADRLEILLRELRFQRRLSRRFQRLVIENVVWEICDLNF